MIPMTIFDANCLYVLKCLALVFLVAPCVLFAGGMLICLLMWCGLHITRAMHLRQLGLPRCGRCRYWATVKCPLYGHNTPSDFCSRRIIETKTAIIHDRLMGGPAKETQA